MKEFHLSWNGPETVLQEMFWKRSLPVYPCLKEMMEFGEIDHQSHL